VTRVKKKPPRKRTPDEIEAEVLTRSLRRCTLCFHLKGNLKKKHGQVAHLNGDRSNYAIDNLAFMCLKHHTLFDSTTSQHKNYTLKEVKGARARLYAAISQGEHLAYKKGTAKPQPGREADAQTLEALIKLMASTGTIDWLRGANFAGWSFDWSRLEGIEAFFHQKGPEHEFIDTDLEALRKNFHAAVAKLLTLLATETYPVGSGNRQAIPEDWEDEQPERFQRAVKEAHETSDLVCKIYDDLVRAAKRRLSR
jgi:5-methylcytosine-specific restriction endonuclease McrA